MTAYLPKAGDLVWVNFDPQAGREPAGGGPQMLVICPITRTDRLWGTRIALSGTETTGFVMVEQVKSVDWKARGAAFIEHLPRTLFDDVKARIATMLDL